jgi:spoIIIJ-associated protein
MERIYEGKNEQEAIDIAADDLGLERDEFEVEILETQKAGIFGLSKTVRIRVHLPGEPETSTPPKRRPDGDPEADDAPRTRYRTAQNPEPETDFEHAVVDFTRNVTEKMGFPADVVIMYRDTNKLGLRLDSQHANILIGRKGKNLDALQVLVNVVAGTIGAGETKIILDTEGYRARREEQLIQLAHKVGDQVKRSRGSKLLEPMNPFERRLIHTTLNDIEDIGTESEGEGLFKQVRVFYRGSQRPQ